MKIDERERERERGTNGQSADALLKNQDMDYYTWVMLMSVLRVLVNNPLYESFDTTFMENKKNCQNINYFFSFPIKIFFNWIVNKCPKKHSLALFFLQ